MVDGLRYVAYAHAGLARDDADIVTSEVVVFDAEGNVEASRPPMQPTELRVRELALVTLPRSPSAAILSADDIVKLGELAKKLESLGASIVRCLMTPDGEPCVVDVTPLEHDGQPGSGTPETLWVRAAVDEAPCAPLTPLSAQLLRQPLGLRGRLAAGRRAQKKARLAGTVASIHGRPYLSLATRLERDIERDPLDLIGHVELGSGQWTRALAREPSVRPSLARAGLRIAQIASEQKVLGDEVARFERDAEQQRRWLAELDSRHPSGRRTDDHPPRGVTVSVSRLRFPRALAFTRRRRPCAARLGAHQRGRGARGVVVACGLRGRRRGYVTTGGGVLSRRRHRALRRSGARGDCARRDCLAGGVAGRSARSGVAPVPRCLWRSRRVRDGAREPAVGRERRPAFGHADGRAARRARRSGHRGLQGARPRRSRPGAARAGSVLFREPRRAGRRDTSARSAPTPGALSRTHRARSVDDAYGDARRRSPHPPSGPEPRRGLRALSHAARADAGSREIPH